MTQQEMYEASFGRPRNYMKLSAQRQWDIDAGLGILDWDGLNLTAEQKQRIKDYYVK
jgi:Spy/CpxP family protein refolding chaperone